jgi:hypothetical protein
MQADTGVVAHATAARGQQPIQHQSPINIINACILIINFINSE